MSSRRLNLFFVIVPALSSLLGCTQFHFPLQSLASIFGDVCTTQSTTPQAGFNASVTLTPNPNGTPINTLLAGSQLEAAYQGDGVMAVDGNLYDWCAGCAGGPYTPYTNSSVETWNQPAENLLQQMNISTLRFPSGGDSQGYHWQNGIGPLASRGLDVYGAQTGYPNGFPALFGTQEYLELCEALGAQPQIIVNVSTGGTATLTGAQEAAAWVSYVNKQDLISRKTGNILPKVKNWEIGNENYNDSSAASAAAYLTAAISYIPAMKAVDPTIKVGIPLYTPMTWSTTVVQGLAAAGVTPDFAISHQGYSVGCNTVAGVTYPDLDLYQAAMSFMPTVDISISSPTLNNGNPSLRPLLDQNFPGANVQIGFTEYALYPIYGNFTSGQGTYIGTLANALYVADFLSHIAQRSDVLLADELTALSPYAGAVQDSGTINPVYYALQNFGAMQKSGGTITPITISAGESIFLPSTSTVANYCSVWAFGTANAVPAVSGYATLDSQNITHVMLLNKSPTDIANVVLQTQNWNSSGQTLSVNYTLITSSGYFDYSVTPQVGNFTSCQVVNYAVPAHSLVFLNISNN